MSKADPEERFLALIAVCQVRLNGGILEHPAESTLWKAAQLPPPGGFPDEYGGRTIQIDQVKAGHTARKRTWLYIVGAETLPPPPTPDNRPTHALDNSNRRNRQSGRRPPRQKQLLPKSKRSATPEPFARWLIAIATQIKTPERNAP